MVLLQLINIGLISARQQGIDTVIVVTVLRRAVNQTLAQLLMGQPVKVIGQRGGKLLLTDNALFEDQFFHGGGLLPGWRYRPGDRIPSHI